MPDRFAELIRGLRVGVVVQGPSTEVLVCNPAALELLGLDESQYAGRTSYDPEWNIVREDGTVFDAAARPMARVLASGQAVRNVVMGVFRPRTRDRVWLLVNAEPELDEAGHIKQVVATLIDITERKRLESSLLEARKLESIGRLAGGVAHDFNNLLTVIIGSTSLAAGQLPAGSPIAAELAVALEAATRAGELTRQLLMFARKRAGTAKVVDVRRVLDEAAPLLRRVLGSAVILRLTCVGEVSIRIDPVELEQVLMNLAANARDAMPSGGTFSIRAENVLGPEEDHRLVRLRVADDGAGMDAETRDRAFDPFFTTKDLGKGTGLGLATVHGVVVQHGGQISIESEPGRGTTFVIDFPAQRAQVPAAARPLSTESRGSETILLAEDEAGLRRLAKHILSALGYRVITATDGRDALAVAAAHQGEIHLLLTDMRMPNVNGGELARQLRAVRPGLRVLISSGFAADAGGGADDWPLLDKPYTPVQLAERVRQVLDAPLR
jgi:PAS domain S-box-containing protein